MNQGRFARLLAIVLLSALAGAVRADELRVTLGGHVLPALSDARVSPTPKVAVTDGAPISLTMPFLGRITKTPHAMLNTASQCLVNHSTTRSERFNGGAAAMVAMFSFGDSSGGAGDAQNASRLARRPESLSRGNCTLSSHPRKERKTAARTARLSSSQAD